MIGSHSSHGVFTPGPAYPGGVVYYDNGDGTPNYIEVGTPYNNGAKFRELGMFVEDVMTLGRRFTLSMGLRFDDVRGISQDVDDLALTDIMSLSFNAQGTVAGARPTGPLEEYRPAGRP